MFTCTSLTIYERCWVLRTSFKLSSFLVDSGEILDQELDLIPKEKTPSLQVKLPNNENENESRTVLADSVEQVEKPATEETPKEKEQQQKKPSIKWSDLMYRDPCKHWCQTTSRWLTSFPALLSHLHSDDYQNKLPIKDKPWKKRLEMFTATLRGKFLRKTPGKSLVSSLSF